LSFEKGLWHLSIGLYLNTTAHSQSPAMYSVNPQSPAVYSVKF